VPRFNITPKDVKRSKIVKPGWYNALVEDVKEEAAKSGDSNNVVVDMVGQEGDATNVPFRVWFSEKAPGMAIPFIKACGGKIDEDKGGDFEFSAAKGKRVKIKVSTGEYKGKPQNQIDDYAPVMGASVETAAKAPGTF
jgi:hypothetical protein